MPQMHGALLMECGRGTETLRGFTRREGQAAQHTACGTQNRKTHTAPQTDSRGLSAEQGPPAPPFPPVLGAASAKLSRDRSL